MRILVVGVGSIGERHVRCMLATERADVAICEPNATVREAVAAKYAVTGTFSSLEEAAAHGFDGAVIATPATFHVPQARALVERSIPVLIEKPLSLDVGGLPKLETEIAARGVPA